MNEAAQPRDAVLTLEWEYITGMPEGYKRTTPVWIDIDGVCSEHGSEVAPPKDNKTFAFEMETPWITPVSGQVVCTAGHLHDGGVDLQIIKNGEAVCDSPARYGESAGYIETTQMEMDGMAMDMEMLHISSMGGCSDLSTREGDGWTVRANYDFGRHEPMMDGQGGFAPVMGIALLYIAT
jgi:hypothetical protein